MISIIQSFRFKTPIKADVVILDTTNSHFLKKVIDRKSSIFEYETRPPEIWIGIKVIAIFLQKLFSHDLKENIRHSNGIIIGLFKYFRNVYIESMLIFINPKYVITYIDNNELFGWLSKNCKEIPFIAIQNGGRLSYAASGLSGYYCQHLFCFGKHEKDLFPKIGYQVDNFYPVGSLASSLYFNNDLKKHQDKYDLLIVSTWRGNIGFQKDVKDTMRSMKIMDELLAKYINSRNINAAVILRSEENSKHWFMPEIGMSEYDYYKNIYGDSTDLIMNDFSERPIYKLIQESHMVVSVLSTALVEAFGFGKKVLFYNFCESDKYHLDFDPLIVSSNRNFQQFSKEIDDILAMPVDKYKAKYNYLQKYYMSFPTQGSTKDYIKNKISSIVKKELNNY